VKRILRITIKPKQTKKMSTKPTTTPSEKKSKPKAPPAPPSAAPVAATTAAPVAAPATPPAAPVAPATEEKKKKRKAPSDDTPAAASAPVVAAPVAAAATEPVEDESAAESADSSKVVVTPSQLIENEFKRVATEVVDTMATLQSIRSKLSSLNKSVARVLKEAAKSSRRKTKQVRDPSKPPLKYGFDQPVNISAKMAEFMGVPPGTQVPRPDVMNRLREYTKEHGLVHGKNFVPDDTLRGLFTFVDGVEYNFFNIQKQLSNHCEKKVQVKKTKTTSSSSSA
jgi:chromatin remodeling complex protein RSC6